MNTKFKLVIGTIFYAGLLHGQVTLGTLKGKIVDNENKVIPQAKVWVEGQGSTNRMLCGMDGKFAFQAMKPGVYNVKAVALGKDTTLVNTIQVKPDAITDLGAIALNNKSTGLPPIVIIYEPKLIEKDVAKIEIKTEDIAHSPNIQNPKELFASMNSDIIIPEGTSEMIIRGSRPGDVIYYVDGVKSNDLNGVPGVGIGSMMGYTGGIPAKYGDTTGGVVILETKSYFDLYYAWRAKQ